MISSISISAWSLIQRKLIASLHAEQTFYLVDYTRMGAPSNENSKEQQANISLPLLDFFRWDNQIPPWQALHEPWILLTHDCVCGWLHCILIWWTGDCQYDKVLSVHNNIPDDIHDIAWLLCYFLTKLRATWNNSWVESSIQILDDWACWVLSPLHSLDSELISSLMFLTLYLGFSQYDKLLSFDLFEWNHLPNREKQSLFGLLYDHLPCFVKVEMPCTRTFLSVLGGRAGIIWNTAMVFRETSKHQFFWECILVKHDTFPPDKPREFRKISASFE